jgi:hypothetical protein
MESNSKRGQGSFGLQRPHKKKKNSKLLKITERKGRERNRLLPFLKKNLLYKLSSEGVE